ncbi:2-hydroxy-3-oxopropionate reductase [Maribacter cobaltidurans]|uniref:2-hydroxy-3-oxopropionate reductase n=1 Tax=Maribacter cobaltidurans TaxID=1178778 RepID=A0A223V7C6_9FLAO|nr:2-hydroxy-3-oxopropionate reductase [Maribacter cobaltidurans]ASV31040.1 2-hydroxy-3-oxopropionate reductase [Maribacter cobaltidurans]GGD96264.1 2-hydroxy-3-oxopropionate reductase [Maribacter cobaltidurans]
MKVGFIGLGIMGKPMSINLINSGYELVVLKRDNEATSALEKLGAVVAESPKAVAEIADVVITMLPDSPEVKDVVLGVKGIIKSGKSGLSVIDMSSISPIISREIFGELEKVGMDILDAPVSGGEPKAIDGTLSVMVGGKEEVYKKYYDLIKAMAGSVVRVGETGAGNIAKLCNQIIVALNISAVSEALILAQKAGVSPELVYNAIRGGLAGSTVLDAKAPLIMDRKFSPGFRISLHIKDLKNVLETSHTLGIPLPLSASVMEMMQAINADGLANEDHCSLVKYYEKITNVVVGH